MTVPEGRRDVNFAKHIEMHVQRRSKELMLMLDLSKQ